MNAKQGPRGGEGESDLILEEGLLESLLILTLRKRNIPANGLTMGTEEDTTTCDPSSRALMK